MGNLLPAPLAGDSRAVALDTLAARMNAIDLTPLLVYMVDLVDASVLPFLAEQFHVMGAEGWAYANDEASRRRLIKSAVELHRHKGTRWAVEQVFQTLALDGQISEWFQYGGEPGYFRALVDVGERSVTAADYDGIVDLITAFKRASAHLEALSVRVSATGAPRYYGGATLSAETTTVYPRASA
ncbi:MAG: phage tail protein I [Xanthomonadaceae bacterium]|nr:phage tail protein I [Xanthomonadaceae bacterium]